ncbi:hypothetical protein HII36_06570 [Nonomuraea sp. NN258]|uniref:hypothetical protein n=1 Tax=Nonomuraea antri TaxID=2730852 RepID=UPI00156A29CB|nr:hypothetical protein [Nonomuraea antri]NRQ31505.1 hypothetical protein [Nonomuraea antri]
MISSLSLVRRVRPYEDLGGGSSRTERWFLDLVIDGDSLLDTLAGRRPALADLSSVLGLAPPFDENDVGALLGRSPSPLTDGRIPLYVCPECGDLGCGAVTAVVERAGDRVVWRDLGRQTDYEDEVDRDGLTGLGPYVFDRARYEAVLTAMPAAPARPSSPPPSARGWRIWSAIRSRPGGS